MTLDLMVLAPDGTWTTVAPSSQGIAATWDDACWYVFTAPEAEFHPQLAALLHRHGAERPDVDVVYGDEVITNSQGGPPQLLCKPDFDETQLISQDYIALPVGFRGRAMAVLGGLDASAASAQLYDILLRAVAAGLKIGQMTQVLAVSHTDVMRAATADRLTVLKQILAQGRPDCDAVPGLTASSIELRRTFDDPPPVTILVVPSGRMPEPMDPGLLDSLALTDWPMDRLHIVVKDGMAAGLDHSWPFTLRRVAPGSGRTATVNRLWQASSTEHVVWLDEGLLAHGPGWLRGLMTFAVDESIGGVGARLLNRDGSVQHAGAMIQREWSMVSGGAFATRRSVLDHVNGLDERFRFDNSQADLCLRLRLLGLRIVYTPHAEFTQRDHGPGDCLEADETALFLQKWRAFMADDPAYHPRLISSPPLIATQASEEDWWRQRPNSRPNHPRGAGDGEAGVGGEGDGGAGGFQSA